MPGGGGGGATRATKVMSSDSCHPVAHHCYQSFVTMQSSRAQCSLGWIQWSDCADHYSTIHSTIHAVVQGQLIGGGSTVSSIYWATRQSRQSHNLKTGPNMAWNEETEMGKRPQSHCPHHISFRYPLPTAPQTTRTQASSFAVRAMIENTLPKMGTRPGNQRRTRPGHRARRSPTRRQTRTTVWAPTKGAKHPPRSLCYGPHQCHRCPIHFRTMPRVGHSSNPFAVGLQTTAGLASVNYTNMTKDPIPSPQTGAQGVPIVGQAPTSP